MKKKLVTLINVLLSTGNTAFWIYYKYFAIIISPGRIDNHYLAEFVVSVLEGWCIMPSFLCAPTWSKDFTSWNECKIQIVVQSLNVHAGKILRFFLDS